MTSALRVRIYEILRWIYIYKCISNDGLFRCTRNSLQFVAMLAMHIHVYIVINICYNIYSSPLHSTGSTWLVTDRHHYFKSDDIPKTEVGQITSSL